jgi:hypothetical protein
MTVVPTGHGPRFPGPIIRPGARRTIEIRLPIADSTP